MFPARRHPMSLAMADATVDYSDSIAKAFVSCWLPWNLLMKDVRRGYDMSVAYGNTTLVPTVYGPAFTIVGDNGAKTLSFLGEYTGVASGGASVWFIPTTIAGADRSILFKGNGANGMTMYVSAANKFCCKLNPTTGGTATTLTGTTTLVVNKLYHCCVIWRSGGLSELYLNGVLEASDAATVTFDVGTQPVWLPGEFASGFPNNGMYLRCDWYNRALSQPEVVALSLDRWKGLKPRRMVGFDVLNVISNIIVADWADNFGLTAGILNDGGLGHGDLLTLSDQVFPSEVVLGWSDGLGLTDNERPPGVGELDTLDVVTFADSVKEGEGWEDELDLDDEDAFVLVNSFGDTGEVLRFRGEFRADTGDLANGRYRR